MRATRRVRLRERAISTMVPIEAVAIGAQVIDESWLEVTYDEYPEDGTGTKREKRGYKLAVPSCYPSRERHRVVCELEHAGQTMGVIEIWPRRTEQLKRQAKSDPQLIELKLGVNVLRLPRLSVVNLKCPLRLRRGVPCLVWRGASKDVSKDGAYAVVLASQRSMHAEEHVREGTALEERGLVRRIATEQAQEYQMWVDVKLLGG